MPLLTLLISLTVSQVARAAPPGVRNPDEVLLVLNGNSRVSESIANEYRKARHIRNVIMITCKDSAGSTADETISYAQYKLLIETPIRKFLGAKKGIDFIVLTKGIPIRVAGAPIGSCDEHSTEPEATRGHPSVDSLLASLDYGLLLGTRKIRIAGSGAIGAAYANQYWNATQPFSHAKYGGYLVTRLDGYTEADAKRLIAESIQAESAGYDIRKQGKVLLDVQPAFGLGNKAREPERVPEDNIPAESSYDTFNADMIGAADILAKQNVPVELDLSDQFVGQQSNLIGYFSWGSNDAKYSQDSYESLTFAPGSLCDTAVSTSARTFLPTQGGQSLIADLIGHGVTCIKGYCDEPLLQAIASPSIAFDRYTKGYTMAESLYAASAFVGWEDIVIGDPLCCPYRSRR